MERRGKISSGEKNEQVKRGQDKLRERFCFLRLFPRPKVPQHCNESYGSYEPGTMDEHLYIFIIYLYLYIISHSVTGCDGHFRMGKFLKDKRRNLDFYPVGRQRWGK